MVDISSELARVQIDHIKKELKKLRACYYDEVADYEYDSLCRAFGEMLSQVTTIAEELTLYTMYYQAAVNYLFRNLAEDEGTEYVSEDEIIEDGQLPF